MHSLDGLRGLAALVVLLHHALLVVPQLAAGYLASDVAMGNAARIMLYSPLHIIWAGRESVYLFFVLSGIVLARAALAFGFDWGSYVTSRLARLYLPVIGAVVLGGLNYLLVPRSAYEGMSSWIAIHPPSNPVAFMIKDALLLNATTGAITPLWSLQWEVVFSLLLAAYIFFALRAPLLLQIIAAVLLCMVGFWTGIPALQFLPMFALGTAMGAKWELLQSWAERLRERRLDIVAWPIAVALAILLISSYWIATGFITWRYTQLVSVPFVLAGVVVIVAAAAFWPAFRNLLSTRLLQWLGAISFSLYLVHEPIIVAFAHLFEGSRLAIVASIVVSLVVAQLFWMLVERPSHAIARRIKRARVVRA